MHFRTEIEPSHYPFKIGIKSKVLTLGSCFSEVIGRFLAKYKINEITNPYGTLFNPISISNCLLSSTNELPVFEAGFCQLSGTTVHLDYHSKINSKSKESLKTTIEELNTKVGNYLENTDLLIITFGTAWVHETIDSKRVVANCHKQDEKKFAKRILSLNELMDSYSELLKWLKFKNPELQILLSVSPIIHTREGLVANNLSKSLLVYFAHELSHKYQNVHYFPGFELLKDDLRDYRFYGEDLIHPNEIGEKYVTDYFKQNICDPELQNHILHFSKIQSALNHIPFNPYSEAYLKHLQKLEHALNHYPFEINSTIEKTMVNEKIEEIKKAIN